MDNVSEIDRVKEEIAALRTRYQEELAPLKAKLTALEEEILEREGLFDLDEEEEAMREHLNIMM